MHEHVEHLVEGLSSADDDKRLDAAEQLARMGEEARGAGAALIRAAADENESVKEWAAAALEGIGPPADAELAEIAELVKSEDVDSAYWAVTLLGRAGNRAAAHVRSLAAALEDYWAAQVRQRAAWACGKIGPAAADAKPALKKAALSSDARLKRLAEEALSAIDRHE